MRSRSSSTSSPRPPPPPRRPTTTTSETYLRFSNGATQLGARRVVAFEAKFTIDLALAAAITAPLTLKTMTVTPGGNGKLTANPLQIRIPAGAPPVGSAIAVNRGGTIIPVFLEGQDPADAKIFIADRELYTGPSLDGTAVTWQRLSAATDLSTDAVLPVGLDLTYAPGEIRRAPGGGFLSIESAGGRTIRTVTARAYDALVLNAAAPGVADPVHVERFTGVGGGVDEAVASRSRRAARCQSRPASNCSTPPPTRAGWSSISSASARRRSRPAPR